VGQVVAIILSNILISNFILFRFLGLCPFLGVSKQAKSAFSMGLAVIFVMVSSCLVTWFASKMKYLFGERKKILKLVIGLIDVFLLTRILRAELGIWLNPNIIALP